MTRVKLGLCIPNHYGVEDPAALVGLGLLAEELGYDSIWTAEHLLNVGKVEARLGTRPYHEPLTVLAYLAARTRRVLLGTSMLVLPYHEPLGLAKVAATLDVLAGGRLALGVAPGWMPEEFAALGIPLRERGSRTDEAMDVLRLLWSGRAVSHAGRHFTFADAVMSPRPVRGSVPLLVGGNSPAALERAARRGDGWQPSNTGVGLLSPAAYAAGRARITARAAELGRDPGALAWHAQLGVDIDGRTTDARRLPPDAGAIAEVCAAYAEAGVEHVLLSPTTGRVEVFAALMRDVARARPS